MKTLLAEHDHGAVERFVDIKIARSAALSGNRRRIGFTGHNAGYLE